MSVQPQPFDIYGPLPPAASTTVLEASAGTGKTWTIAALVTRMVAEGVTPLQQMLVITFGRQASQELRERVRERLVQTERAFSAVERGEPAVGDEFVTHLLNVDAAERTTRANRLRAALGDFDAATIVTTHGFCDQVLKGLGVAGDTDPRATLVENLDDLLDTVVDDLYVRGFARPGVAATFSRDDAGQIAFEAVKDPSAELEPTNAAPDSDQATRLRFALAVKKELALRKRRLGVLSFDDLLVELASALEDPASPARERMRQRWSVVLVDEFQDTDPVQWQVLDRAFSGHARMILIGDPKQAIYAFRGGDIATYLTARESAAHVATLGTNHRTDAPLLTAVHTLLGGAELGDPQIVVHDVSAHHPQSRLHNAPNNAPLRLRMVRPGAVGLEPTSTIGQIRTVVAADLAADIAALLASPATLDGRPVRASDIAVLCESHTQCGIVAAALAEAGIPAVLSGGGSIFTTDGARQWLTLLDAIDKPQRSGVVRSAGLTAFFGHTAEELGDPASSDALTNEIASTLREWGDLMRHRGVAAVVEAAGTRLSKRVLRIVGGERLLTDLRHVGELLHEHARSNDLGPLALTGWLRHHIEHGSSPSTTVERPRRLDSDAAAVQILTIHVSKGMEFGIVYLPFLCDNTVFDPKFLLYHDAERVRRRDVGGTPFDTEARRAHTTEELGEDLRLLYVAITRAKTQVITWWFQSQRNTSRSSLHRLIFGRQRGVAQVPEEEPVPFADGPYPATDQWQREGAFTLEDAIPAHIPAPQGAPLERSLSARVWEREIDRRWRRTSYSSLSAAAEAAVIALDAPLLAAEPEVAPLSDEPDISLDAAAQPVPGDVTSPMAALPMGATFGSLVHMALEHADPDAPDHGGDVRAELRQRVLQAQEQWPVADLDVDVLVDALVAVCDSPLGPLAPTTLRQIPLSDRLAELDFELPLHGGDETIAGDPPDATLADLGPILRHHLPPGDPLLPYADVVEHPGYAAQSLRGYLTGSVDVVFRVGGRYLVADYKTNWLGSPDHDLRASDYSPAQLVQAMTHSSYPLQALLYAVVLHRFLRWRLPGYDPEQHIGGVLYLYVRGMCGPDTPVVDGEPCGVFSWRPPTAMLVEISDLLDSGRRG